MGDELEMVFARAARLDYEMDGVDRERVKAGVTAIRRAIAREIEDNSYDLGEEGWQALADKAAEADFDPRKVWRRRGPDTFTSLTIEAAYQYGYRRSARIARGEVSE